LGHDREDFLHVAVILGRENFSEKIHNSLFITLVKMNGYATLPGAQRQSETGGKFGGICSIRLSIAGLIA
jgi:hypothetical protein